MRTLWRMKISKKASDRLLLCPSGAQFSKVVTLRENYQLYSTALKITQWWTPSQEITTQDIGQSQWLLTAVILTMTASITRMLQSEPLCPDVRRIQNDSFRHLYQEQRLLNTIGPFSDSSALQRELPESLLLCKSWKSAKKKSGGKHQVQKKFIHFTEMETVA